MEILTLIYAIGAGFFLAVVVDRNWFLFKEAAPLQKVIFVVYFVGTAIIWPIPLAVLLFYE